MPLASLRLTIPEGVWIGELTRQYPETVVRILAAFSDETAGVGLATVTGEQVPAIVTGMTEYDDVDGVEVLQHSESKAIVQFETTMPLLLRAAQDSGVPLEMPFEISEGEVRWEVTAPNDRLSALGDQLDTFGISFSVDRIQQRITDEQLLTERQQRLVEAAVEAGYYDTPRDISLTTLAEEVGIAKSTASETLHRAESAIVKDFVDSLRTMTAGE